MVYLPGGGGESGRTALIDRENRIRERERVKVLDELWKFCLINGAEEHGDLIGLPKDPFFPLKLIKKIAEMRYGALKENGNKVLDDIKLLHDAVGFNFKIVGVEHVNTSGGKHLPTRAKYEIVVTELRQEREP